ncbi:hypothetical protein [Clostridium fallax]|nr:hypothetical protein [Clostridium fallax]
MTFCVQNIDIRPILVLTPFQRIAVIDFNRWKYGYKYEEFYKIQSFNV